MNNHIEKLTEIRSALADRNLAAVAKATQVPYMRLIRIARGTDCNPRYLDIMCILDYLEGR